jgi:hypothetical protein
MCCKMSIHESQEKDDYLGLLALAFATNKN